MSYGFKVMPPAASTTAVNTDHLYYALLAFSGLMTCIFVTLIVWFCYRYRRASRANRSNAPVHANGLEAAWTIAPTLVFLALFVWAARDFSQLYRPPADATPMFVVAKQWMWKAQHANGRREIDELHVPVGQPVRLLMTSQDVIHSFSVPAFRIKQDLVPGRYTSLWFEATQEGEYHLFCAEYCGTDHALMRGRVVAMPPERYAAWLEQGNVQQGIAVQGFTLFREQGCIGCHGVKLSVHAPDLRGLLGRRVRLQDGSDVIADENYVRDSILEPQKQIVAGFEPIMPSFKGQLDEEQIIAIIEYLRSTRADQPLDAYGQ